MLDLDNGKNNNTMLCVNLHSLQMPVSFDLVVMLEQNRFDRRGELHVQVEHVDREGHHEEAKAYEEDPQKEFQQKFGNL